ncbi:hypothetical protein EDD29_5948 [Actinocorallia herbida]|uniref:Uncharacterized protein n=2 Tax=Actinocorallia herbida TaxID=58109 RepID=A0A3N1D440_9ACTN|nr:hypothetical protein EDD29_5948 [Actinocorallia herbida]
MTSEFDYFKDRVDGKLFDLILQLGSDLHVASQRVHSLEALLVRKGVLTAGELDALRPTAEERTVLDARRDALIGRMLRVITEDGPAEHPLREQWEASLRAKSPAQGH